MTKEEEKKEFKRELWKVLHDENGNPTSRSEGSTLTYEEYVRMSFPPKIADEMIKESREKSKSYSKSIIDNDSPYVVDFDEIMNSKYEDL